MESEIVWEDDRRKTSPMRDWRVRRKKILIRLTDEEYQNVESMSDSLGVSMSSFGRQALRLMSKKIRKGE